MKAIDELVQPHILKLDPYIPGKQPSGDGWIKLNTNEFPYAPPKAVLEAIEAEAKQLARYPNPTSQPLREVVAEFHGLHSEQVIIGNGSDDILNLLARAFGGEGRDTFETFPSYSLYPVLTAIAGGSIHSISFNQDFSLPVEELLDSKADLLFLTCPNAPTGIRFPMDELRALARDFSGLLVIDEAYAEFAEVSAVALLGEFENVVITRTFSKAYGLAGLRVGYGLASTKVIGILDRVRDSYNVNRLSQAGAIAAMGAQDYYQSAIEKIKNTRESVRMALEEMGWRVYPSEANFLFAEVSNGAGEKGAEVALSLFTFLEERKILVRYFSKHPLTEAFLRISIGTPSEMERFIEEVRQWQKSA
jgi:histidinol-phosphate aminotransferase